MLLFGQASFKQPENRLHEVGVRRLPLNFSKSMRAGLELSPVTAGEFGGPAPGGAEVVEGGSARTQSFHVLPAKRLALAPRVSRLIQVWARDKQVGGHHARGCRWESTDGGEVLLRNRPTSSGAGARRRVRRIPTVRTAPACTRTTCCQTKPTTTCTIIDAPNTDQQEE
jgi:hypothetical protein